MEAREELLRQLNKAFAKWDIKFLADNVSDNFRWVIVGERTISGRKDFKNSLEQMKRGGPMMISVIDISTFQEKSLVEGTVEFMLEPGKKRKYSFCDVYVFSDSERNKVAELRTYVTQMKKI